MKREGKTHRNIESEKGGKWGMGVNKKEARIDVSKK